MLKRPADILCCCLAGARIVETGARDSAPKAFALAQASAICHQSRRIFGSAPRNVSGAPSLTMQRWPGLPHNRSGEPSGRERRTRLHRNPTLVLRSWSVRDRLLEHLALGGAGDAPDLTYLSPDAIPSQSARRRQPQLGLVEVAERQQARLRRISNSVRWNPRS